jgi:hypothetical protein
MINKVRYWGKYYWPLALNLALQVSAGAWLVVKGTLKWWFIGAWLVIDVIIGAAGWEFERVDRGYEEKRRALDEEIAALMKRVEQSREEMKEQVRRWRNGV